MLWKKLRSYIPKARQIGGCWPVFRLRYSRKSLLRLLLFGFLCAVSWNIFQLLRKHTTHQSATQGPGIDASTQADIDYISSFLQVEYQLAEINPSNHRIVFTNTGQKPIIGADWEIFFNHAGGLTRQILSEPLILRHINGWLYGIKLRPGAILAPKEVIALWSSVRLLNRYYAFPRWYVTTGSPQIKPRILRCTDSEQLDFIAPRHTGNWLPQTRYDAHNYADLNKAPKLIIPTPVVLQEDANGETIHLGDDWKVVYRPAVKNEAIFLAETLKLSIIENKKFSSGSSPPSKSICLFTDGVKYYFSKLPNHQLVLHESYKLSASNNSVVIIGQSAAGLFYGVQSLLSLLASSANGRSLPAVSILDAPRLPYRGLMLDVSRNFLVKETVLTTLDVMAMYKMNKLHFHLSNDQGWRLEIPGLPELTYISSKRGHASSEESNLYAYLGSGPLINSTDNHGTGFYSANDYQDILRHASQRHIQVIPEIDMPGHSHAAIQSLRVKYAKMGQTVGEFSLSDPNDTSIYSGVNDVTDSAINPCMESTFAFVHHVMKALIVLHKDIQSLTVFNLGGDEVPFAALMGSPICRRFFEERNYREGGLKGYILTYLSRLAAVFSIPVLEEYRNPDLPHMKRYFITRVSKMAADLQLSIQSWEDGFASHSELPSEAKTWNNDNIFVNTFLNHRTSNVLTFADAGYKVVMSYASHFFLDNPHEPDFEEFGLSWAAKYVDVEKVFRTIVPSHKLNELSYLQKHVCDMYQLGLCNELRKPANIIGLQASLWTELVRTPEQLEYMLYPRLLAVAERGWHEAEWQSAANKQQLEDGCSKDLINFINTLGYKELRRLESIGIHYRLPPPGIKSVDEHNMIVNTEFPGLSLVSSIDGGKTWKDYPAGASRIVPNMLLATRSFDGKRRSRTVHI